jgi:hypothetical protein
VNIAKLPGRDRAHSRGRFFWSYGSTSPTACVSIVRAVGSAFLASICLSWSALQVLHLRAFRKLTSRGVPCRQDEWRQTTCTARSPRELCSARLGVPLNDPLNSVARRLPPRWPLFNTKVSARAQRRRPQYLPVRLMRARVLSKICIVFRG